MAELKPTPIERSSLEAIGYDLPYYGDDPELEGHLILALEKLPSEARDLALDGCVFLSVGRVNNGVTYPGTLAKSTDGAEAFRWLITLDESMIDRYDEDDLHSVIAHEVAHAFLGHDRMSLGGDLQIEFDACRLTREWGFTGRGTDESLYSR